MDKERCSRCNKEINRIVRTVGDKKLTPKYCSNCGEKFPNYSSKSGISPSSK